MSPSFLVYSRFIGSYPLVVQLIEKDSMMAGDVVMTICIHLESYCYNLDVVSTWDSLTPPFTTVLEITSTCIHVLHPFPYSLYNLHNILELSPPIKILLLLLLSSH